MLVLFGPLSSASQNGPGAFFSWLFLVLGSYCLVRIWRFYFKHQNTNIPLVDLFGVTALAVLFIAIGFWGLFH